MESSTLKVILYLVVCARDELLHKTARTEKYEYMKVE
jgi:hypothetical protein